MTDAKIRMTTTEVNDRLPYPGMPVLAMVPEKGTVSTDQLLESSLKATMIAMNTLAYQMELRIREDGKEVKGQKEVEDLLTKVQKLEKELEQA